MSNTAFNEVCKASFCSVIGQLDVQGTIVSEKWPYTTEFFTAKGKMIGRKVGYVPDGDGRAAYRYYLRREDGVTPAQAGKGERP